MKGASASPEAKQFRRAVIYARVVRVSFYVLLAHLLLVIIVVREGPPSILDWVPIITASVSFLALVISALGTASTIMLGWRSERRQAQESRLKIAQLELQLAEARVKPAAPREQP